MSDLFISYAREDQPFVRRLQAALSEAELDVWVDWEDIPPTVEWMREVEAAIEGADAFVVVLSPDWIASRTCARELDHAARHGKRIVIVGLREVAPDALPNIFPMASWISCDASDDLDRAVLDRAVAQLVGVIRADPEWVHEHTRLVVRAVEWERREHDRSVLLRGRDLEAGEAWQAEASTHAAPAPTGLQLEYVAASRRATTRGLRIRLGALVVALAVTIGLSVVALIERAHATQQSDLATARELAASSVAQQSKDSELSLQLAVASMRRTRTDAGERALRQAIADSRIRLTVQAGTRRTPPDSAAFTPDGGRVAVHVRDGSIRLFDATQGTLIAVWRGRGIMSRDARPFSPDGTRFLTVDDGNAKIWDTQRVRRGDRTSGHPLLVLGQPGRPVRRASFNPAGTRVVTADEDGTMRIWDAVDGGAPLIDVSPPGPVSEALFDSDGSRVLAISGRTGAAWIYDANAGGAPLVTLEADTVPYLLSAAWLAGDQTFALTGLNGTTVFGASTGTELAKLSASGADELAASPRGDRIVVGNLDGTTEVRSTATGEVVRVFHGGTGYIQSAAYSLDGTKIVTASADGGVRVWDADPPVPDPNGSVAGTVAVSADGRHALIAGAAPGIGTLSLWRVAGDQLRLARQLSFDSLIASAAFSPDSLALVAGLSDGSVRVLRVRDGRELMRLPQQTGAVTTAAYSRDGTLVLTVSKDETTSTERVRVFEAADPRRAPIEIDAPNAMGAVFASRKHRVLTIESGGRLRLWDLAPHAHVVGRFDVNGTSGTIAAAFSRDPTRFATANADGARLWDVSRPPGPVRVLRPESGPVFSVAFTPDGTRLLTGDSDGSVTLWDARSGSVLAVMTEHSDRVYSLAVSPDGHVLSTEFTTTRWFACDACRSVDDMLAIAGRRITRSLTDAERRTFLHES